MLLRQAHAQELIAARVGVTRVAVSHWVNGVKRPGAAKRALLAQHFGVPVGTWDEPSEDVVAPDARTAPAAVPRPTNERLAELEERLLEALQRGLTQLEAHREELSLVEYTRIGDRLARMLRELRNAQKERDAAAIRRASGQIIAQHPDFPVLERALDRALRGHPDAARRVAEEFESLIRHAP